MTSATDEPRDGRDTAVEQGRKPEADRMTRTEAPAKQRRGQLVRVSPARPPAGGTR